MRLYFSYFLALSFSFDLGLSTGYFVNDRRRPSVEGLACLQHGYRSLDSPVLIEYKAPIINIPRAVTSTTRKRSTTLSLYSARRYSQIVPIQIAANCLWLFYAAVERQARGPWSTHPPQRELWVRLGNLRICFVSLNEIPWSFVASFAAKMINATLLGYTGTYDIVYMDPEDPEYSGIMIWLRVIDRVTGNDLPLFEND